MAREDKDHTAVMHIYASYNNTIVHVILSQDVQEEWLQNKIG